MNVVCVDCGIEVECKADNKKRCNKCNLERARALARQSRKRQLERAYAVWLADGYNEITPQGRLLDTIPSKRKIGYKGGFAKGKSRGRRMAQCPKCGIMHTGWKEKYKKRVYCVQCRSVSKTLTNLAPGLRYKGVVS